MLEFGSKHKRGVWFFVVVEKILHKYFWSRVARVNGDEEWGGGQRPQGTPRDPDYCRAQLNV